MVAEMKKKIGNICKLAGLYFILYIMMTAVFIGMFHTPLFKNVDVFMYRGILFLIIAGIIAALLMIVCMHVMPDGFVTGKDAALLFCGFCCVNMVLFTLIPVTVERSVSVFMLSYMDENDDVTYTQEDIGEIFVKKYVNDYGAFEKRFREQVVTGSIQENGDGTYHITERGKQIVNMFRTASEWFCTDERLVYPNEH